ncbi:MAG TPA: urate oxidase [Candidatus Acidoferrales bacterium]|nr:urate oxidase [Candidatus Acidoferrales bacterium]
MSIAREENSYGESSVRLLRVARQTERREIKEMTLEVRFEGDFGEAQTQGDNREILPPETIRNTIHALARQYPSEAIEDFSLHLIEHFLTYNAPIERVRIEAHEDAWARITHGGKPHASAFARASRERRTASLCGTRDSTEIHAGLRDLFVLKAANAGFEGFRRDPYTTLKENAEALISAELRALWLYKGEEIEFNATWHGVRQVLLEAFAEHESRSFPHTLRAMGEAVFASFDPISEISLWISGEYCAPAELDPLGMDNPGQIFLPAEAPRAVAQATLRRA